MSVDLKNNFLQSFFLQVALCCAVVFVAFCLPYAADAATLRVVPSNASMKNGETISVAVTISSTDQAMNAVSGVLKFPAELLQVVVVSKAGSVLGLWVQEPSFSNSAGTVNFEGIALNPGYTGSNGSVVTVTFRAREEGNATLTLENASVLANDGNGTSILSSASGGTISIGPAPAPVAKPKPASTPTTTTKPAVVPEAPIEEVTVIEPEPVATQKAVVEKPFDLSKYFSWFTDIRSLVFIILIITFGILNVLLFIQYMRLRSREGGGLDHAQIVAHRSFLLLRDDIDTFAQELEEESKKRDLSSTEKRFVKEMRGDLTSAEKAIVKELRESEKRS